MCGLCCWYPAAGHWRRTLEGWLPHLQCLACSPEWEPHPGQAGGTPPPESNNMETWKNKTSPHKLLWLRHKKKIELHHCGFNVFYLNACRIWGCRRPCLPPWLWHSGLVRGSSGRAAWGLQSCVAHLHSPRPAAPHSWSNPDKLHEKRRNGRKKFSKWKTTAFTESVLFIINNVFF